jgi:uncharacterized protein YmfQ (DUF2313 family)
MAVRSPEQYRVQLRQLLPQGPAWDLERLPELAQVLEGLSIELARVDGRIVSLYAEMDPASVTELVPDWEQVMGLPDACLGDSPSFGDRQLSVLQRLTAIGAQTPAYFVSIAKGQGYPDATITQHRAPRFGGARFGRAHFGTWQVQFMWTLNTGGRQRLGRRFGISYWGERFGANPGSALECLIRRYAPAHTVVHINYS